MRYAIGLDVGGTNIKAGIVDRFTMEIINTKSIKTESYKGEEETFDRITVLIEELLKNSKVIKSEIIGMGVGIPGPVIDNEIVASFANFPWKENLNISKEMEKRLGIKTKLDNDVNIITLGESWGGAAKGYNHVLGIALGTGIGGGLVINGHLYSGTNGGAGEIGHMKIISNGKLCGCGHKGCWEAYASATGIEREAVSRLRVNKRNLLWEKIDKNLDNLEAKHIFDAAKEGDEFSLGIVDYSITYLAFGLANLITILNPEIIVIGGGISLAGDFLFDKLKEAIKEDTFSTCLRGLKDIVPAQLGNEAGVVGGAALAVDLLG